VPWCPSHMPTGHPSPASPMPLLNHNPWDEMMRQCCAFLWFHVGVWMTELTEPQKMMDKVCLHVFIDVHNLNRNCAAGSRNISPSPA
jgi:hypothetical protein